MNDIHALYKLWKEKAVGDSDLQSELVDINGSEDEILDRFYKNLEFGTAGLRGVIGAGTNRMNIYTVGQATQGLADYLNSEFDAPAVAIAYDSRIKSDVFAKYAAGVLAANNIKVYFYPELVPTPMLSFAVRRLSCKSGIIITASHNPAKYNGYKCYDPEGYQMTDEAAAKTYEFISKTDMFDGVKHIDFESGIADGKIEYIEQWLIDEFYEHVENACLSLDICKNTDLKVIYTPLNGTGNKHVRHMLDKIGIKNVSVVKQQELPDGNFPTCPYPNPEIKQVFELAIDMTKDEKVDLLLATDPDCDRVGIAVLADGEYKLMSGNEVGALLTEYLLSRRKELGTLPERPVIVKSFVTTNLVEAVAAKYGAKVKNLLTGFKYIGEFITELEKNGEESRFVAGMEESYGYLSGIHARDKDAVVASTLICEMAAYYKSKGKSLYEVMQDIYAEHGMYLNKVLNFAFEGAAGMQKMAEIMDSLRANAPKQIGGLDVLSVADYKVSTTKNIETGEETAIELPKSNVLAYALPSSNGVIVRPSGTEPKIKVYLTACADSSANADKIAAALESDMEKYMK
ncbi:MAG: phospho-sugar mutase [Faecalibacterium sp.]|nr:phospho-sugar mutase [Ruminococcus sp.]MCM1392216.1 phospho-sugar mutase [Ruminococcus sp.]MCM1485913.1 phospho-sugar mutase [Faecalibacterium sp.]